MRFWQALLEILAYPFAVILRFTFDLLMMPGRLFRLSIPLRVAVIVFGLLLTTAVTLFCIQTAHSQSATFGRGAWFYVGTVGLIVATAAVTYFTVKMWLEGPTRAHGDIDDAFVEGLASLEAQRINPADVPIYIVLGVSSESDVDGLMNATGFDFLIKGVPKNGPIRWFGGKEAIFIVCSQASAAADAIGAIREIAPDSTPRDVDGTKMGEASRFAGAYSNMGRGNPLEGTILGNIGDWKAGLPRRAEPAQGVVDLEGQSQRLEHLARLLVRTREPDCPFNGVVFTFPLKTLRQQGVEYLLADCAKGMRLDCQRLQEATRLKFPVLSLVTDVGQDDGFVKLAEWLKKQRAEKSRIGMGLSKGKWNSASKRVAESLAEAACANVIALFFQMMANDPNAIRQNEVLYRSVASLRGKVTNNLRRLLADGLASELSDGTHPVDVSLIGCYFVGTGSKSEEQMFGESVFRDRLPMEENTLEWTPEALAADQRYLWLARANLILAAAMVFAIIGLILYRS